jgi:hypothetical protein
MMTVATHVVTEIVQKSPVVEMATSTEEEAAFAHAPEVLEITIALEEIDVNAMIQMQNQEKTAEIEMKDGDKVEAPSERALHH